MADPETWVAIIVGVFTAIGIIYSIIQGSLSSNSEQKQRLFETLEKLEGELTHIKERETKFAQRNRPLDDLEKEVYRYTSDYLNILERISFLGVVGYVDSKTLGYFSSELAYGLKLRQWKIDYKIIVDEGNKPYPYLLEITRSLNISQKDDQSVLPYWLTIYSKS